MWYLITAVVIWTALSFGWVYFKLGDIHAPKPTKWWEFIISFPALVVAKILYWLENTRK